MHQDRKRSKIPKIVHYCWFGDAPLSEKNDDCIQSWKVHLPDFQLMFWNLDNIAIDHDFVKEAITRKNWAFLSDYIRLKVLFDYGGIYLDTDMMLMKSLNPLIEHQAFIGCEKKDTISAGIIGSEPKADFLKEIIEYYEEKFDWNQMKSIPSILTDIIKAQGFIKCTKPIEINRIAIYPPDYFYPYPFPPPKKSYLDFVIPETYAVHLWEGSWLSPWDFFKLGSEEKGLKPITEQYHGNYLYKTFLKVLFRFYILKNILRRIKNEFNQN